MKTPLKNFLPLAIMLSMLTWGCTQTKPMQDATAKPPVAEKQEATVYKGKIVGNSKKAKTIAISVGKGDKAKTMMVKYDDNTKGLEFAKKGEAAIIQWEKRGTDTFATVIKPKLAKLPQGVTEIKTLELKKLIDAKAEFMLIDSRPGKRYAQSHLPGALSIPVDEMKTKAADILPKDKDIQLVFYCGGPT